MNYYVDRLVRFTALRIAKKPKRLGSVPAKQRKKNVYKRDNEVLVSRVSRGEDVRAMVEQSVDLLGGFKKSIHAGQTVMIKPNYNRSNPPPASTSLDFLEAVIMSLKERGAKVIVGECSGPPFSTRKFLEELGTKNLLERLGVELIIFNEDEWLEVNNLGGKYLDKVTMPARAYEVDTMVYLSNMKTHRKARFSLSLKLGVGFTHPSERRMLHEGELEEKIAEINLAWQPDLVIMDGRKAFVTGGPDDGDVEAPGVILSSGDMVAVDLEALKILMGYKEYKADNRLDMIPSEFPQIKVALARGLGEARYTVIK